MNKSLFAKFLVMILLAGSFNACKPRRDITPGIDDLLRSPERAIRTMHANQANFDFFSARFSGNAFWENSNYNVSGTLRIHKDQAIFLSVTPLLGIEVARVLITPDTVKFLNRLQSSYFIGDMRFINNMLGTDLDFYMLQSLLTGNDFEHFTTDNFRISDDRDMLLLSAASRRRKNNRQAPPIEHNIWLDRENYRIRQTIIYDSAERRMIRADYKGFERLDGQLLPNDLVLTFTDPGSRAELTYRLSRTSLNSPQEMTFSVPSRYKPIDF